MIGALWTGISGLASHQSALDNESHNIANVNTVGYKASRISFADQMYQDRIGKGSKILDAEKLYTQGNLKLTGVDYDMALSGDGFFTVLNTRSSGTAETLYTRAGNFRMGDNGTLQDAAGNEVQGWAMRAIDSDNDVTSTNPNVSMFTNDYTKLLTSKVIKHSNYIETITAKATDYSASAKADSETVFGGAGMKSKSAKISDVETLVSNYASWLQKLQDTPDGGSASSTAQISQVNFKTGADGLVSKEGDQVYVFINGNKISQNYVTKVAGDDFNEGTDTTKSSIAAAGATPAGSSTVTNTITLANDTKYTMTIGDTTVMYKSDSTATMAEILDGLEAAVANAGLAVEAVTKNTGPGTIAIQVPGATAPTVSAASYDITELDRNASRIATYKALADKISEIPGLKAYMVSETNATTGTNDVLEDTDSFSLSTKNSDMIKGIIQIESLIPGESFSITEVAEASGNNTVAGGFQTGTAAVQGTGVGALQSAKEALSRAITGNQQDIYTPADLKFLGNAAHNDFAYSLQIYDKDIGRTIPVPNDNATPPQAIDMNITDVKDVDDFVTKFNAAAQGTSPILSNYVEAVNINGNVVIQTLDSNFDVEFSGNLRNNTVAAENYTGVNVTTQSTIDSTAITTNPNGGVDFTYTYDNGAGSKTVTISAPADKNAIATAITASDSTLTAAVNATGDIVVTSSTGNITASTLTMTGRTATPLDKNNDYSGRAGAGAEFIELVNTIDQTTTQSSLQLKLDTLGISDSAFGEFSVDSTGLITMKQDGAEFAIGQVSIALFNNTRGLEPSGDNLLAKTNESGEPIYNLNNDKTAKIEGKTLELSTADLSESLVNLMVFQRAFEANAKSITTSDQLLNTLINLKR